MNIKLFGKNIIAYYSHYIMSIDLRFLSKKSDSDRFALLDVTDKFCKSFIKGNISTISISNLRSLIDSNKSYANVYGLYDKEASEVIGSICVMYRGGNDIEYKIRNIDAYIFNVFIKEKYRGNGYVGELMHGLSSILLKNGINNATLAVSKKNSSAIKAYKKLGFVITEEKSFYRILKVNFPYHIL